MQNSSRNDFPSNAPAANPVFFRTYSRRTALGRETWSEACDRALKGLAKLGNLTIEEVDLLSQMQRELKALSSGRWLWVGGTEWIEKAENFSGAYNCTCTEVTDWRSFGLIMELAMMGSGTGAVIEKESISKLPGIRNQINIEVVGEFGTAPARLQETTIKATNIAVSPNGLQADVEVVVGDSRQGWVRSYQLLMELASWNDYSGEKVLELTPETYQLITALPPWNHGTFNVRVDLSHVRPAGEPLKGFGGVANPIKLPELYGRCASILNKSIGRQLNSLECCLIIDEAAKVVVAGNVRRSAGIRMGSSDDELFARAKDNLWKQDNKGNWRIDPERDALRMSNHTRVFHHKPTLEECVESVRKQYYSGEGAIQWAGEAIARASCDVIDTVDKRKSFLKAYNHGRQKQWFLDNCDGLGVREIAHRLRRNGLNPCGEIISYQFHCNLAEVHLNRIDPLNILEQIQAFTAGAISVASLLHHKFSEKRYQQSRELDPIVGVSFTGLFDFFVNAFGLPWMKWWEAGRPTKFNAESGGRRLLEICKMLEIDLEDDKYNLHGGWNLAAIFTDAEAKFLTVWRETAHTAVWNYCDRHGLKRPNRCTTVQPSGTKSLLTNASPGWHPPKSQRFIRRITFGKNDPVARACIDYGYNVVPSQSDKDEKGNLLNDPLDPRCTEWLVEIPVSVSWADLPGVDKIDISQFSALAQIDFYMQVQRWYVRHNTSATIEIRKSEIEDVGKRFYEAIQNDEGYISATVLQRDTPPFPRLPFEPISKEEYDRLVREVEARRQTDDFHAALMRYDLGEMPESGPAGCDSDKCLMPDQVPS